MGSGRAVVTGVKKCHAMTKFVKKNVTGWVSGGQSTLADGSGYAVVLLNRKQPVRNRPTGPKAELA